MSFNPLGKRSAIFTGWLLIAGLVAGIFSVVPVIDGEDYLAKASANENQVYIGASFQLLMLFAYAGIPISLYPILSKEKKGLALGSVAFGIMSGVFIMFGVLVLLLLLNLSHDFSSLGDSNGSYFEILGGLLREGRDLVNHVATTLAFVMAMLLFTCVFYRTKIVPLWLTVWGLIGSALSIAASLMFMVRFIGLDSAYMILNAPIAVQQLALALWLLFKGFNQAAIRTLLNR